VHARHARPEKALVRVPRLERARALSDRPERTSERQVLREVLVLQPRLDDLDGLVEALDAHRSALRVRDAIDPACEVRHLASHEDFAGVRQATEPRGQIERAAAESVVYRDSLTGVEADPDGERQARLRDRLLDELRLEVDRRLDGLPCGVEHRKRLVAAQLDQVSAAAFDDVAREVGENRRQLRRSLVAVRLGERGVPAHIGDEEGLDPRRLAAWRGAARG
jgi:hypothetical protein